MKMITKQELSQVAFNAFLANGGEIRRIPAGTGRFNAKFRAKLEAAEGTMKHVELPPDLAEDVVECQSDDPLMDDEGEGAQPTA